MKPAAWIIIANALLLAPGTQPLVSAVPPAAAAAGSGAASPDAGPSLASGVRVGEVTSETAIVWVRLTARPTRLQDGKTQKDQQDQKRRAALADGWKVEELEGACPGAPGEARVLYGPAGEDASTYTSTPWRTAAAGNDYVIQFPLASLRAGRRYGFRVETRAPGGESGAAFEGEFQTALPPASEEEVSFTVVTGMMYRDLDHPEGFHIFRSMARLKPSFFVATGDTVYYDGEWPLARGSALARYHWHRMYSLPRIVEFHRKVPGYWIKDDHDTLDNDCWPGKVSKLVAPLTFAEGQRLFREQVPMGRSTYRTVRWGRHLQVWFPEGRDFRSPNPMKDGPEKTIWGKEQREWLKKTLLASDATFKVLVSATPIVGPDRARGKNDNHSNRAFRHAGEGFRRWAVRSLPGRFYVVCGDRHWQYHSVDPTTGLQEFSTGPASDQHAGGTPGFQRDYHRFHRVKGGFLSVTVRKAGGRPAIAFRFHDVHGATVYEYREDVPSAEELRVMDTPPPSTLLESPVYTRLLEKARRKLTARAEDVAGLTDPERILARGRMAREVITASFGGFPEPTPLKARVTGRVTREDHVLEKVIFESRPGLPVTANLYLPLSEKPPFPAILLPCGHSSNGKAGSTYQTAGQEYARRGFAVLVYDPIGQGERYQFLQSDGKPLIGGTTEHTVTGTCALLVGSNTAEVIIHDGKRAIDYLAARTDIDLSRLGCTGNSGGGTQTSYLMALEPRIQAAAPSCYITSFTRLLETIGPQDAEQNFTGYIAHGLDHADFLLAFAPKPALVCAASGDFFDIGGTWTSFREAKRIYGRLGRPGDVDLVEVDAKHGYHPAIRQRVGRFFEEVLLDRSPQEVVPSVKLGKVYPDKDLWCTETGQVVSSLGGRTTADIWRGEEARLRPQRERRFESQTRAEWIRGVRELAGMAEEVPPPQVKRSEESTVRAEGVSAWKISWDDPFPVAGALFFTVEREGKPSAVEIFASDRPLHENAPRLLGRARAGEVILAVSLPGFGETAPSGSRSKWWGADWKDAFLAFHLGRSLAGIRADALRQAIVLVREHPRREGLPIRVRASGRAVVPALLAAAVEREVGSLRLERGLDSYAGCVMDGLPQGLLGSVVPGALAHFDLPLLRKALPDTCKLEVTTPVGPRGEPLEEWRF